MILSRAMHTHHQIEKVYVESSCRSNVARNHKNSYVEKITSWKSANERKEPHLACVWFCALSGLWGTNHDVDPMILLLLEYLL